jgi:fused signal recognition particle receptor
VSPHRAADNVAAVMAREWRDLFIIDGADGSVPVAAAADEEPERRMGRFRRLRESLRKTRQVLQSEIQATLFEDLSDETWERLEEALIYADVGAETTARVVAQLEQEASEHKLTGGQALSDRLVELLTEIARTGDDTIDLRAEPTVILVAGVNGTGKTTTLGKLAWHLSKELNRSVVLAAGDTFRAAAADQLGMWAERSGVDLVRGAEGSDPSSIVFDAVQRAAARGNDLVLADTAGRLHNKVNLVEELKKIRRIADRDPGNVTEVLLVLDATTGQNALVQATQFTEAVDVTGIVLTKLDGTAKGGIVIAVQRQLGLPVKLVGLGEGVDDLVAFDPDAFVDALLGLD